MSSDKIKFGICIVVGLFGFNLVISKESIASIIIGFLLVAAAVVVGTIYQAKIRQPRNPMQDEIDALVSKDKYDKGQK
ncbi:MAG TPA: hypothetical protein VLA88_00550 [Candidatus Saccharimonadales bacterium]|nr:hypothetical protein [Candidatus Saccharimonadales bacterium]